MASMRWMQVAKTKWKISDTGNVVKSLKHLMRISSGTLVYCKLSKLNIHETMKNKVF